MGMILFFNFLQEITIVGRTKEKSKRAWALYLEKNNG